MLSSTLSYHGHFLDTTRYMTPDVDTPDFVGTYTAEWGDAESFEKLLGEHGDEIAMVILEPWLGAGGMVARQLSSSPAARKPARRLVPCTAAVASGR